uniref:Putative 60S ribosomal protein L33 n=1 Tax=Moniliophthora roreri TaxID=221103 RepID=A0A0W0F177_MONRR
MVAQASDMTRWRSECQMEEELLALSHWDELGRQSTKILVRLSSVRAGYALQRWNCELYSKGRVLGHKRGKRNSRPNTSLLQIEGVATKEDAQFYLGKRVAFVYKAKREIRGSKVRVIWGRVTRPHGNNGVVKGKFRSNLPPRAFGASVRVMLYPSTI